ncbi:potassium transporter TrkA [Campylobacterota bacterium]|nr:potassium transporter TrkA [Campylobacterota bacterium]
MKRILILADGSAAEHFVARIVDTYTDTNLYDIVYYRGNVIESGAIHCRFYRFDPTSQSKLREIFSREYVVAFVVMTDNLDTIQTYKNIRSLSKELKIYALDYGTLDDLGDDDDNFLRVSAVELLANRMVALVPNIPVSAQNVGLGQGEIIEVDVPFGSSYAYRHISHIEQKKWLIAAIYRSGALILPTPSFMVRPNDNLLLVGEPKILKTVYRAIKIESGQFPAPYGRAIYTILNIAKEREHIAIRELEDVLHIHKRLKNRKLHIKVINPNSWLMLEKLHSVKYENVYINIDYKNSDIAAVLRTEFVQFNIGLVIVGDDFFALRRNRSLLYKLQKPIWKLGQSLASKIKNATLLITSNPAMEQLSTVFFDLSSQLRISAVLYPSKGEEDGENAVVEHYENIAAIHSRSFDVKIDEENAVLRLRKEADHLLFFPFDKRMVKQNILDLLKPKRAERMYSVLSMHHQIFVPVA